VCVYDAKGKLISVDNLQETIVARVVVAVNASLNLYVHLATSRCCN
jgi:hypothetical protein